MSQMSGPQHFYAQLLGWPWLDVGVPAHAESIIHDPCGHAASLDTPEYMMIMKQSSLLEAYSSFGMTDLHASHRI